MDEGSGRMSASSGSCFHTAWLCSWRAFWRRWQQHTLNMVTSVDRLSGSSCSCFCFDFDFSQCLYTIFVFYITFWHRSGNEPPILVVYKYSTSSHFQIVLLVFLLYVYVLVCEWSLAHPIHDRPVRLLFLSSSFACPFITLLVVWVRILM